MQGIKLIVSVVNGILTDGTNFIDELGNVPFKKLYLEDFEAINELKRCGLKVVFLSSDNNISYHLFRRKNIPFYWAQKDKYKILLEIVRRYNVTLDEVLYVASSISDIKCATTVPISFCPLNANIKLLDVCTVLDRKFGEGVLTDLYFKYFRGVK